MRRATLFVLCCFCIFVSFAVIVFYEPFRPFFCSAFSFFHSCLPNGLGFHPSNLPYVLMACKVRVEVRHTAGRVMLSEAGRSQDEIRVGETEAAETSPAASVLHLEVCPPKSRPRVLRITQPSPHSSDHKPDAPPSTSVVNWMTKFALLQIPTFEGGDLRGEAPKKRQSMVSLRSRPPSNASHRNWGSGNQHLAEDLITRNEHGKKVA